MIPRQNEQTTISTGIICCPSDKFELHPRPVKWESECAKTPCPVSRIGPHRSPKRQYGRRGKLLSACRALFQNNGRGSQLGPGLQVDGPRYFTSAVSERTSVAGSLPESCGLVLLRTARGFYYGAWSVQENSRIQVLRRCGPIAPRFGRRPNSAMG